MQLPDLVHATLVRRDNRFRATVELGDAWASAHVPTSGRLSELLVPGADIWLAPIDRPGRKTPYDLLLVQHGDTLVSIDARLPNALFAEHLQKTGWLGNPVGQIEREVTLGKSRLDLRIRDERSTTWIEIKSVTLVEKGIALFPDAPTVRGTRHVRELTHAVQQGDEAAVIFVAQRNDPRSYSPHHRADPDFAAALHAARRAGVAILAYACAVNLDRVVIARELPVGLHHDENLVGPDE